MDEKMEEQYCNIFANEVLMPRQTFLQSIGEKRHDIALVELKNLQSEFGISVDALMYKARDLDVISENRYTTYWKKKNFDSNFKSQVEKSIIDDEHSTRFENLIYRALSSGLITESKAHEKGLIEGRAPHYTISLKVAKMTKQTGHYTKENGLAENSTQKLLLQLAHNAGSTGFKR